MICKDDTQGIGSLNSVHNLGDCLKGVALIIIIQKLNQYLCICLALEFIAVADKLIL